ncbi:Alpha/beta hydrolase family-domain-containing protein [Hypoxylon sp. NC1633]|nr:Alpha/beta hydrolase family-domain-containing protein [Hypoxylon sp. NC1633]
MTSYFRIVEHIVNCQHTREYVAATANGDHDTPKLAVKQYIPLDYDSPRPGDVTIVGAHATGFPKELYEPLWDDIYEQAADNGFRIRGIWMADFWNQGTSGIVNERILGHDPSWTDHARDLMYLINQMQEEMPHPIVGIGHSMGAAQLIQLALFHPRLLRSLVIIDPVIQEIPNANVDTAILSTARRDIWRSREDAVRSFTRNKFYGSWDSRVLERWIEFGIRPLPTELYPYKQKVGDPGTTQVTLSTSKHQELFTYLRPTYRGDPTETFPDFVPTLQREHPGYPFYRPEPPQILARLPRLRPSVLYVFGQKSSISTPEACEEKMSKTGTGLGGSGGVKLGRVKRVDIDCGHLIPMEKGKECAKAIVGFLGSELTRWRSDQQAFHQYWSNKPRKEQFTIDDKWARLVNPKSKADSTGSKL